MDSTTLAYIAGFLDGDGSIFFQIIRRKDYVLGYQIRSSLAFYQKTEHYEILEWLKSCLNYGYIRHRKTGISDYTVVAPKEVREILLLLRPYVRLKKPHVELGLKILDELPEAGSVEGLLRLCNLVDYYGTLNYSKKRSNTTETVRQYLIDNSLLAPVETSSEMKRVSEGRDRT